MSYWLMIGVILLLALAAWGWKNMGAKNQSSVLGASGFPGIC